MGFESDAEARQCRGETMADRLLPVAGALECSTKPNARSPHLDRDLDHGISTTALEGDDATYAQLATVTARRNQIVGQMIERLENAAFNGQPIDEGAAGRLIDEAYHLIAAAR
jgi:hypothetical protein